MLACGRARAPEHANYGTHRKPIKEIARIPASDFEINVVNGQLGRPTTPQITPRFPGDAETGISENHVPPKREMLLGEKLPKKTASRENVKAKQTTQHANE